MKKQPKPLGRADALRRLAEHHLRKQQIRATHAETAADTQRILHELQVHQIELELQNEELRQSKAEVDAGLERYTDLYEFSPIGYISLDEQGLILEVNLTGAILLGMERSRITSRRFQLFVAPESRPAFNAFLETVFAKHEKLTFEALLLNAGRARFWAELQAISALTFDTAQKWCRVAVIDISARKQAEEAQRRADSLAATNQELDKEIVRRCAVEAALRKSELRARRLVDRSHQTQKTLHHLTHQLIVSQEEERKAISRELHDGVVQTLIGVNVTLSALANKDPVGVYVPRRKIAQIQQLVQDSVHLVHSFARGLRPAALDDLGLIPALHAYCKGLTAQQRMRIKIKAHRSVEALDDAKKTVLFRVAQEALTNVVRHARATEASVAIAGTAGAIRLEISDNGRSFHVDKILLARSPKRLGLIGMKERIEMVGGSLTIESAPGKGTTVRAEIPVAKGQSAM